MGLTKEYFRYVPSGNFNIIASPDCNIKFVLLEGQIGRYIAVGACEHIIIWDLRLGEKAQTLLGERSHVSYLCANPNNRHLAAGYADGNVQVYDLKSGDVVSIFSGHKTEVTALAYDQYGHKLATGSKDTDVIVWDTVSERGICRFSGHKGPITALAFMSDYNVLISSSKDSFVKFWDLDTQHCFKTLVGHRTEVWSLCLMKQDRYLVTGCGDSELRVWKLTRRDSEEKYTIDKLSTQLKLTDINNEDDPTYPLQCVRVGSLLRVGRGRVVSISSDVDGQVLTCYGTDTTLELFKFCSDEEANVRFKKRLKKELKKLKKTDKSEGDMEVEEIKEQPEEINSDVTSLSLRDEVRRLPAIKATSKLKAADIIVGGGNEIRVAVSYSTNIIEMYSLQKDSKDAPVLLRTITSQGHRSDVRAVAFSSDSLAIASGSAESVKLWNRSSHTCLRTIETGYVLSLCFVPGDRHVLCGLKDGRLIIMDIAAGDVLEEIPAHTAELWSVSLLPDLRGCVTGGGDKTCKFWNFELIRDEQSESKAKVLSLLHTRTLALEESVLCVRCTPNDRFVAVALLDSTVKIFFSENFKLFLTLYGHKLPVLCMDISHDSRIIATGSADRNIKIWGLDFGDCHKSIFAHDDSVTGLQFVGKTHHIFSCGKDGSVKEWDADNFEKIITLPSHHGEARCLAVSPNGKHVVTCGSDKVMRSCELTDQLLVLEDEREEEREREEVELATGDAKAIPGQPGLTLASKKTIGSEKAADSLLECLEVLASYKEQLSEHAAHQAASKQSIPLPPLPPIMQVFNANTPEDFLLETIRRIRSSDLEEALLILPFTSACELLQALSPLVARGDQTELVCRVLLFLLRVHHAPLVANKSLLSLLKKLQKQTTEKVTEIRDIVGYNYHGLQFLQRELEINEGIQLFRDATLTKKSKDKKRKQRQAIKRSITVLSG